MALVSIFISVLPLAIIILVVWFMTKYKDKTEEQGDELMRNLYVYLVLFATLMMSIGGSVSAFMAVADIVSPAPYYQSFEEYVKWGDEFTKVEKKSEEELRASYDAMIIREQEQAKQRAVNSLIKSFGWIVIPLPIFLFFQRKLVKK